MTPRCVECGTELQQATWWVRAVATFAALPRVEQVGIYEIKDQRPGTAVIGDAANYFLGLTRADRTPKLAFRTVRMLVRLYGGGRLAPLDSAADVRVRRGSPDSVFHHVVLRTDGAQVLVVWSRGLPASVDLTWPRPATTVREYRLDGTAVTATNPLEGIELAPGLPRIFEARP